MPMKGCELGARGTGSCRLGLHRELDRLQGFHNIFLVETCLIAACVTTVKAGPFEAKAAQAA